MCFHAFSGLEKHGPAGIRFCSDQQMRDQKIPKRMKKPLKDHKNKEDLFFSYLTFDSCAS